MRTSYLFITASFLFPAIVFSQAIIEINNPSHLTRNNEVIVIPWDEVVIAVRPGIKQVLSGIQKNGSGISGTLNKN